MGKRWFALQTKFDGTLMPVVIHDYMPGETKSTGEKTKLTNIKEIEERHYYLTLENLRAIYAPTPTKD